MSITSDIRSSADTALGQGKQVLDQAQAQLNDVPGQPNACVRQPTAPANQPTGTAQGHGTAPPRQTGDVTRAFVQQRPRPVPRVYFVPRDLPSPPDALPLRQWQLPAGPEHPYLTPLISG